MAQSEIRLVGFDVDGTLTDGTISYIGNGQWSQRFSVADGMGITRLLAAGVEVAIVTAKDFESTRERMKMLGVGHCFYGVKDKLAVFSELAESLSISLEQAAFMGDDLPDLEVIKSVGLGATVAEAPQELIRSAAFVAKSPAGHGAAREFAEYILQQRS